MFHINFTATGTATSVATSTAIGAATGMKEITLQTYGFYEETLISQLHKFADLI
jgi:hypothetical protein